MAAIKNLQADKMIKGVGTLIGKNAGKLRQVKETGEPVTANPVGESRKNAMQNTGKATSSALKKATDAVKANQTKQGKATSKAGEAVTTATKKTADAVKGKAVDNPDTADQVAKAESFLGKVGVKPELKNRLVNKVRAGKPRRAKMNTLIGGFGGGTGSGGGIGLGG